MKTTQTAPIVWSLAFVGLAKSNPTEYNQAIGNVGGVSRERRAAELEIDNWYNEIFKASPKKTEMSMPTASPSALDGLGDSSAPTATFAPSAAPTATFAPSAAPPTVSPAPTVSLEPTFTFQPTSTPQPTITPQPTMTTQPSTFSKPSNSTDDKVIDPASESGNGVLVGALVAAAGSVLIVAGAVIHRRKKALDDTADHTTMILSEIPQPIDSLDDDTEQPSGFGAADDSVAPPESDASVYYDETSAANAQLHHSILGPLTSPP